MSPWPASKDDRLLLKEAAHAHTLDELFVESFVVPTLENESFCLGFARLLVDAPFRCFWVLHVLTTEDGEESRRSNSSGDCQESGSHLDTRAKQSDESPQPHRAAFEVLLQLLQLLRPKARCSDFRRETGVPFLHHLCGI